MNRIDLKFKKLRENNEKALITFLTAGDPSLDVTRETILEMERCGAAIVEIGVPFSDPIAEGPVIQRANVRALNGGVNLDKIMDMVSGLRKETDIPLVYLMYFNSILSYGIEHFFERCKESGIDGVIIPDLPYEESEEIYAYTEKYDIYQISMIAPTSTVERMKNITERAKGFLYCVSSLGVTGIRKEFKTNFNSMFEEINSLSDIPKCIGFGISTADNIRELKKYADGLIVGSALVKRIEEGKTDADKIKSVGELTKELYEALCE